MNSLTLRSHGRNTEFPRLRPFNFRLVWRRDRWELRSSAKYRQFETLAEAMRHVRWLQRYRAGGGPLHARIDQRDRRGRWHEVPELARLWSEGGWR